MKIYKFPIFHSYKLLLVHKHTSEFDDFSKVHTFLEDIN